MRKRHEIKQKISPLRFAAVEMTVEKIVAVEMTGKKLSTLNFQL